jgi:hypothetical protein
MDFNALMPYLKGMMRLLLTNQVPPEPETRKTRP